jgi:biotin transporter BioY
MPNAMIQEGSLPFKCRMLCLSLALASLILLLLYLLVGLDYLSTETAIWLAVGVFIAAAVYESFLFTLITRHLLRQVNRESRKP